MEEKALKIINNYDIDNQLRKLIEEIYELQKEINIYELKYSVSYEIPLTEIVGTYHNIEEEFADCLNVLLEIKEKYQLDDNIIKENMNRKLDRTLERIENENNNK